MQSILQTGQVFLESFYEDIGHKIHTSDVVGFDEIGYPVDGKNGRMRVARTATESQYVLEYSRGGKIQA